MKMRLERCWAKAAGAVATKEAANKLTSGVVQGIMSSRSMADTAVSAKQRGLTDKQAFSLGVVSAAAEAITEKYSLDAIFDSGKTGWKYVLQNVVTEGSEETASNAINFIADVALSKDKSEWKQNVTAYRERGYTKGEAFGKAFGNQLLSMGTDALAGMISGGVISGSVNIVNSMAVNRTNRAEENEMVRGMQQWLAKRKTNSELSYRIGRTENNEPIVVVDEDILEGVPEEKWIDTVKKNLKKKFPEGVKIRNDIIKINSNSRGEITESEYSKWLKDNEKRKYADKFRATNNADEILKAADNWIGEAPKHERKDNIVEFARGTVIMKVGRKTYRAEVDVATTKNGSMQLHDIVSMEPVKINVKSQTQTGTTPEVGTAARTPVNGSNNSIPQTTSSSQENNNKSFAISRMLPRAGESGPILPTAKEEMEARERQRRAGEAKTETERTGILYGVAREDIEMAGRISKAIGRDVVFYENAESGVENDDGYYDGRDGKIYINAKSKNALPRIIAHEMTHSVELADSYIDLFRTVIRHIQKTGGSIQEMRNEIKTRYENNGVKLSHNAQIDVEIMAEYIAEHLLTDEVSITNLAKESPKSARGILRFLDSILAKLGNTNAQERVFVAKARALYAKALGETQNTMETESERMRTGSRTEATPAKTETSSETTGEKHPIIRENVLPTAAERFGNKTAEAQDGRKPAASTTENGIAESRGVEGMAEVEAIVSENLRPEITKNAELMEMLRAQFGADGTAALARQIKAEVERTGTVGRFGVLFSDGGMAVEEALGAGDVSNGGERQFSISKDEETEGIFSAPQEVTEKLSAQVDTWLQGGMRSDEHFDFGKTPEVLKQLGAQNLPIVMNQSVMVKITGGSHAIALDTIKDIPNAMADPVMIFKSNTVKNAFVVVTEFVDKEGMDVVVALHLNKFHNENRINRIASVYGKKNLQNFIETQSEIGNLKYIDKNKSQAWSIRRGLQLPKLNAILDSNNSILQKENVVNRYRIKKSGKYAQNAENKSFSISEKQENGRQYSIGKEKGVAKKDDTEYNKYNMPNRPLKPGDTFPPSGGASQSEANQLATTWAHREDVENGERTIISYHGALYTIQKDVDAHFRYTIVRKVPKKEHSRIKRLYGEVQEDDTYKGKQQGGKRAYTGGARNSKQHDDGRTRDINDTLFGSDSRGVRNAEGEPEGTGGRVEREKDYARSIEDQQDRGAVHPVGRGGRRGGAVDDESIQYAITKDPVDTETTTESAETTDTADFWDEWLEKVKEYGAMPKGEKPARDIEVPKKIGKNKPVSQTVRTILEAKVTPDEAIPTIEQMVLDGEFSYEVHTDKKAIKEADGKIEKRGYIAAYDAWAKDMDAGKVSKENTALGWALYNQAATSGDIKTATTILNKMVQHQRNAAQALQATRILKQLSPEGQLYQAVNAVEALQQELKEKYGDKAPDLKIDENLAKEFLEARTQKERDEIKKKIYRDIGRQMPSRFIDKWNAWRYLAMLGNPRTHIRNIVGNAGFAPVVAAKNLAATTVESIVYRVSGGKTSRTKAFIVGTKYDRDLLKAAWNDYKNVAEMISNGGKYSDAAMANRSIEEGRRVFKFVPLEAARKGNSWLLEAEDVWFSKPHYAYALAQYCKANHISLQSLEEGKLLDAARPRFFFFGGKIKTA